MFYQEYMTREQYDRIVAEGRAKEAAGIEQYPHCNPDVIHEPGTCAFCDGRPSLQRLRAASGTPWTPAEANGWGGNTAPKVDDDKADAEDAWQRALFEEISPAPAPRRRSPKKA